MNDCLVIHELSPWPKGRFATFDQVQQIRVLCEECNGIPSGHQSVIGENEKFHVRRIQCPSLEEIVDHMSSILYVDLMQN